MDSEQGSEFSVLTEEQELEAAAAAAAAADGDDNDSTCEPRAARTHSSVVLAAEGENYVEWKTIMPAVLGNEPYCWEVVSGKLNPPTAAQAKTPEGKTQQKNYNSGNRAGRYILINSISKDLNVELFCDNAETVSAQEIWRLIKNKFTATSGELESAAQLQFMNYKFQTNIPASKNLVEFKKIVSRMKSLGTTISEGFQCTQLLNSLPASWESFRSGWMSRAKDSKKLALLYQAIEDENRRLALNNPEQVTAMFSRLSVSRGRHRGFSRFSNTRRTVSQQSSEVVCYRCHQRGHIQRNCRRQQPPRPPPVHRGRGRPRGRGGRGGGRPSFGRPQANIVEALMVEFDNIEANSASQENPDDSFTIDSGCSHHMIRSTKWLSDFTPFVEQRKVRLGGSRFLLAKGHGTASVSVSQNGHIVTVRLADALVVPNLRRNLISVGKLADEGCRVEVTRDAMTLRFGKDKIIAHRSNGLFSFSAIEPAEGNVACNTSSKDTSSAYKGQVSLAQAHRTFAHINIDTVKHMLKREGYEVRNDFTTCSVCTRGKMHRSSYRRKPTRVVAPRIGYMHADLCSLDVTTYGGAKHFLVFTDDASRFRKLYLLKTKDEVATHLADFLKWFHNQSGQQIYLLKTDEGREFRNRLVQQLLK